MHINHVIKAQLIKAVGAENKAVPVIASAKPCVAGHTSQAVRPQEKCMLQCNGDTITDNCVIHTSAQEVHNTTAASSLSVLVHPNALHRMSLATLHF